ncbi:MAG: hypothetical protein JWR55_1216 [Aeromicrobium sp.]|jgi:hypothetical protein|nr:hypothetical protein [Aeromicrobium sp.]
MDTAWDRLLDLLDHLTSAPGRTPTAELERTFSGLAAEAIAAGDIDTELHVPDVARWLAGLVIAHAAVRTAHPEVDPDADLADLRRIVTRWLHPARPR